MKSQEGLLKDRIKKHLDSIGAYRYMPVPYGYGKQSLDFLICVHGKFLAVETKAPGKKPTRRQELCISEIIHAGGVAFWCDSFAQYLRLMYETGFIEHPCVDKSP
jgi:hypothetical protein